MTGNPEISVILPVYNAGKHLKEAIDSILKQTFKNFELIIINDGSTDDSAQTIASISDSRIRYFEQSNAGLAATLNRGISLCRADYIARMDNDDVSLPQRLEKQKEYLDAHPEVILLGTCAEIVDNDGADTGRHHDHLTSNDSLKYFLLFNNPFVHSSVMFRKHVIEEAGNYDTSPVFFEDYNLWSRLARCGKVENLSGRLLKYREVHTSMSRQTADYEQRVINQSTENILYYCPSLIRERVRYGLSLLCGAVKTNNYLSDLRKLRELLKEINQGFSQKEKIPLNFVSQESERILVNFRRHHFNAVLADEKSGFLQKLKARLMRKYLFMRFKKYIAA